jgi:hypothetical protein
MNQRSHNPDPLSNARCIACVLMFDHVLCTEGHVAPTTGRTTMPSASPKSYVPLSSCSIPRWWVYVCLCAYVYRHMYVIQMYTFFHVTHGCIILSCGTWLHPSEATLYKLSLVTFKKPWLGLWVGYLLNNLTSAWFDQCMIWPGDCLLLHTWNSIKFPISDSQ